jgi:hypothetical protein
MNEVYKQTILSGSGILQYHGKLLMVLTIIYGSQNREVTKFTRWIPNTGAKTTVLDISMGSTWLPAPSDTLMFNSIVTGHKGAWLA